MTKARDENEGLHRLEDIETQEVSVVDRAANKRKFLIVKRSAEMNGPEVVENEDGTLTTKSNVVLRADWKEPLIKTAADALERLSTFVDVVKGATESTDENLEFPSVLAKEITEVAKALSSIELVKASAKDADKQKPKEEDDKPSGSTTYSAGDDVSKASHWMREMKSVFDELRIVIDEQKSKRAPQDAPNRSGPNAGSGVQPDTSVVSDAATQFRAVDSGLADMMKSLETLTTKVDGGLSGLKDTITKQAKQIESLKSGVGLPASQTPSTVEKANDDVAWPADMNRKARSWDD